MMTLPAIFTLLVLACPDGERPGHRECVAVVAEVGSVAECRSLYQEIKATLPENMKLGFPECVRIKK